MKTRTNKIYNVVVREGKEKFIFRNTLPCCFARIRNRISNDWKQIKEIKKDSETETYFKVMGKEFEEVKEKIDKASNDFYPSMSAIPFFNMGRHIQKENFFEMIKIHVEFKVESNYVKIYAYCYAAASQIVVHSGMYNNCGKTYDNFIHEGRMLVDEEYRKEMIEKDTSYRRKIFAEIDQREIFPSDISRIIAQY